MDVLMPQLGETVDEGKVLVWYKKVGDKVEPGENLFEIETEKVSMEVPSTVAGTLQEIRVQVDETAPVGAIVAVIVEEGAQAAASAPAPTAAKAPPRGRAVRASARRSRRSRSRRAHPAPEASGCGPIPWSAPKESAEAAAANALSRPWRAWR